MVRENMENPSSTKKESVIKEEKQKPGKESDSALDLSTMDQSELQKLQKMLNQKIKVALLPT